MCRDRFRFESDGIKVLRNEDVSVELHSVSRHRRLTDVSGVYILKGLLLYCRSTPSTSDPPPRMSEWTSEKGVGARRVQSTGEE